MLIEEIDSLDMPELSDLLVTNSLELLNLLNQKRSDGYLIHHKGLDLQLIQSVIAKKKTKITTPISLQHSSFHPA